MRNVEAGARSNSIAGSAVRERGSAAAFSPVHDALLGRALEGEASAFTEPAFIDVGRHPIATAHMSSSDGAAARATSSMAAACRWTHRPHT